MTGLETVQALKIKLDKLDTDSLAEIAPEVAVFWINDAFIRLVKQRYGGNNPKRESFEETQKRTDDLREVISYVIIENPTVGFFEDSVKFDLPVDYWFALIEQADVVYTDCNGDPQTEREGVKVIQHNNINTAVLNDPFWKPEGTDVLRVMQGKTTVVFHATGSTVPKYYLGYINNGFKLDFNDLSVELKIADHLHPEIVDLAYNQILNAIESGRYQQDLMELSKSE